MRPMMVKLSESRGDEVWMWKIPSARSDSFSKCIIKNIILWKKESPQWLLWNSVVNPPRVYICVLFSHAHVKILRPQSVGNSLVACRLKTPCPTLTSWTDLCRSLGLRGTLAVPVCHYSCECCYSIAVSATDIIQKSLGHPEPGCCKVMAGNGAIYVLTSR